MFHGPPNDGHAMFEVLIPVGHLGNMMVVYGDSDNPIFNGTIAGSTNSTFEIDGLPSDPGTPPAPSCGDDLGDITPSAQTSGSGDNTTDDIIVNITGMANDSLYPSDYLANVTEWIQPDLGISTATSSAVQFIPSTTTATPTGTPACDGNQVQANCVAAILPSTTPFAGPLTPSCVKADGDSGTSPRLNATKASDAASTYCQNLVDDKWVLSADGPNPKAATLVGEAENGADMSLVVMYDEASCPQDQSSSTLDIAAMGVDACFENLYTNLEAYCSQDPGWGNYDPEWTFEGGVAGNLCGLWSINGE